MPSINFDYGTTQPIADAGPGRTPLRRRASAPQLANLSSIYGNENESYDIGNMIRIQLPGASGRASRTVHAQIVKAFAPFTMAPVVVVRITDPTANFKGNFVLKLYDRRHSNKNRREEMDLCWSRVRDMEFEKRRWNKDFVKYFLELMDNEQLEYTGEAGEEDGEDNQNHNELEVDAYDELWFQVYCLKMYRAELEVYRRAREHCIDGIDVPRFISSVRIPPSYISKHCQAESSNIKGIPGILMQYIPGFSMTDLYDIPNPLPPRTAWKPIIDDSLHIVQYYSENMEMTNMDLSLARNTVVHWNPIGNKWKCKLIDFGHCVFRGKTQRRWDWRKRQSCPDQEFAIGQFMSTWLMREKGFEYTWVRSRYSEELVKDFNSEFSTGVEPSGYSA